MIAKNTAKQMDVMLLINATLFLCLFSACGGKQVTEQAFPPPSQQYTIGPEDILKIDVWKEPQLSISVPVRSDGKISLPLINDV